MPCCSWSLAQLPSCLLPCLNSHTFLSRVAQCNLWNEDHNMLCIGCATPSTRSSGKALAVSDGYSRSAHAGFT